MANKAFQLLVSTAKMGPTSGTAILVSDAVMELELFFTRATVDAPRTMAVPATVPGAMPAQWFLKTTFLPDDTQAATLWQLMLTSSATADGLFYFEGMLHPGAVGAANPKYSGNVILTGAGIGGKVGDWVTHSETYPLIAAPTVAIV